MSDKAIVAKLDPQALIAQAIQSGAGIETLERMVALAKDVRAEQAREAWHRAISEFQRTCPPIKRTETANIGGKFSYTYAPLGEIMQTILPVLGPLGLSVSYRVTHMEGKVVASARVSHEGGHFEESGPVAMPVVDDRMGANAAQRVGIASTYAKRYALLAILGLAPEDDTDAHDGTEEKPAVQQPRRRTYEPPKTVPLSNEPEQAVLDAVAQEIWRGKVKSVTEKTGETNGKAWTLWTLEGDDGTKFGTFDSEVAAFARDAGNSPVEIAWTTTPKGGKRVVQIDPDLTSD